MKGPIINGQNQGAFGFNFADGHIKAYGTGLDFFTGAAASSGLSKEDGKAPATVGSWGQRRTKMSMGLNDFVDNSNGTVTDTATG